MTLGERIRAARVAAGLTQAELGAKLGVPYQSIGQYERGIRNPKYETLQRIAQALGVHVQELMDIGGNSQSIDSISEEAVDAMVNSTNAAMQKILDGAKGNVNHLSAQLLEMSLEESARLSVWNALLSKLNDEGQRVAVERVEELTEIPKYRKDAGDGEK